MPQYEELSGLDRREVRGRDKRVAGVAKQMKMLPTVQHVQNPDLPPENKFCGEAILTSWEDSYCGTWSRMDVIDSRTRSLFVVSMMSTAGGVGNQFELGWHAPAAMYNGASLDELECIIQSARMLAGGPVSGFAQQTITRVLTEHGFIPTERPKLDLERREKSGSEKRVIAREVVRQLDPKSPLLDVSENLPGEFGCEIDLMILENWYWDQWERTDVLDWRMRSIVVLGQLIGLNNWDEVRSHVPVALRTGVTLPELEELTYNAATYMGIPTGRSTRRAVIAGVEDAKRD